MYWDLHTAALQTLNCHSINCAISKAKCEAMLKLKKFFKDVKLKGVVGRNESEKNLLDR